MELRNGVNPSISAGASGGIAPDLRYLEQGESGDQWFAERYRHGSSHDGKVYMPPFGDVLGQKTGWAIRAWLETKFEG